MKLGSLCSGAGALDLAVEQVFGAETVWHCETDPAASKVLAHRWPGVPNHGDLTTTDWSTVEPVDIVCGGFPCQPFSLAGKRKGLDDERAIWPHIARAIGVLRPRVVVLENVSALLASPEFTRVADSMAPLGYDLRWTCLRASDVGAPHRRERLFVLAYADEGRWRGRREASRGDVGRHDEIHGRRGSEPATRRRGTPCACFRCEFLASHTSRDGRHEGRPESAGFVGGSNAALSGDRPLLPTPAVNDIDEGKTVEWWDEWTAKSKAKHGNGNGHGNSLAIETQRIAGEVRLLPTPRTSDTNGAGAHGDGGMDLRTTVTLLPTPRSHRRGDCESERNRKDPDIEAVTFHFPENTWGKYAPAIKRWEHVLGRPAPPPTEPNRNGNPRLNPAFSEFMMGWPAGWVTDIPGISRNDALRIIGNGVVPQQAAAALQWLLSLQAVA